MAEPKFNLAPAVSELGVRVATPVLGGLTNIQAHTDFEALKARELEALKVAWAGKNYKDDPALEGFRTLHTKVGRSNRDYVASPEALRRLWLERGRFPQINLLVDIYNLVSVTSGLALGAHDISRINGNITLRLTTGDETFIPLGKSAPEKVFPGEYAYVDDANNIICRMEVLQVEPTKVTLDTTDVFLIVQGNENTSEDFVRETAEKVCTLIEKFCRGRVSRGQNMRE